MTRQQHALRRLARVSICVYALLVGVGASVAALQERGPTAVTAEQLDSAIDHLGDLDYPTRVAAGRTVRRAPAAQVVPALARTVAEHGDGYVRFRALVLLSGFKHQLTIDAMNAALTSPNDRLREVAFGYFEQNPDPARVPAFLAALEKEQGDFVRPALVRALAAIGNDPRVRPALQRDIGRGVDHFRSSVIEALGDYRHVWAVEPILAVAKLDGPLQDDAAVALGKIGDQRALPVLAELQRTAPRERQGSIAASICLLGVNCSSHVGYLQRVLAFAEDNPGYQELVRGAAAGLGAIAVRGNAEALTLLFDAGIPAQDPTRAPIALATGLVALRNTPLLLDVLQGRPKAEPALELLAEGFDMLEEDFEEERFFATVRRGYWAAPEGGDVRRVSERLITKLDF